MHPFVSTLALTLILALDANAAGSPPAATRERQTEVAERGAEVMPFDLDATEHKFVKTPTGGVQRVVAKQADDAWQVATVRAHLAEIAREFANGDFSDPRAIHGAEMPGLATLEAAGKRLNVMRVEIAGGAEIRYLGADAEIVAAIHDWFDAQVSDHGRHATAGHH